VAVPLADESENGEPGLLLRSPGRLLQSGDRGIGSAPGLEHAHVRQDREQVLRKAVVDVARDSCALIGHGAAELRGANCSPHARHQKCIGRQRQEVALRDVRSCEVRRQDLMQLGEEHQRRGKREPAVEILPVRPEAKAEADERSQDEQRLHAEHDRQRAGLSAGVRRDLRQPFSEQQAAEPQGDQREADRAKSRSHHASLLPKTAAARGRRRDQGECEHASPDTCPGLTARKVVAVERGHDREREEVRRRGCEPRAEQQIEAAPFDREAESGQYRDDGRRQHDRRIEKETEPRQVVRLSQLRVSDDEKQAGPEQAEHEHLSEDPALVGVRARPVHIGTNRQRRCSR
jgi:hypothetical protein